MITTQIFKIDGMHCTSCAMTIDMDLEDLDGVEESRTNYAKQVTEVKFDPDKVSKDKIIETIKKTGYGVM
jgi:Cu+-exporting ATPase